MRREVLIDSAGRLLASAPHPEDIEPEDENAPRYLGLEPDEDQQLFVVEFPDEVSSEKLAEIHSTHHVRVTAGRPI